MSTRPKDGGAAFPTPNFVELDNLHRPPFRGEITSTGGMSLRDWFAGKVLNALTAGEDPKRLQHRPHEYAGTAYELADAMLVAREAKGGAK